MKTIAAAAELFRGSVRQGRRCLFAYLLVDTVLQAGARCVCRPCWRLIDIINFWWPDIMNRLADSETFSNIAKWLIVDMGFGIESGLLLLEIVVTWLLGGCVCFCIGVSVGFLWETVRTARARWVRRLTAVILVVAAIPPFLLVVRIILVEGLPSIVKSFQGKEEIENHAYPPGSRGRCCRSVNRGESPQD